MKGRKRKEIYSPTARAQIDKLWRNSVWLEEQIIDVGFMLDAAVARVRELEAELSARVVGMKRAIRCRVVDATQRRDEERNECCWRAADSVLVHMAELERLLEVSDAEKEKSDG